MTARLSPIRFALCCAIAALVAVIAGCRSCPPCAKPVPPPPVTIIAPRPHCVLPMLPEPMRSVGVPDAQRDGYFVPRQSWALLGGYISGIQEWIDAATECLERP